MPSVDADNVVNLGDEGLKEGDTIGPYIEPNIQSNTLIEIPTGSYRWDDSSVFNIGGISNFGIIGDGGDVVLRQPDKDMTVGVDATSGTVKMKNLRFANMVSGGSHQYSAEEGANIVLDNYQRPDGTSGGGIGILIPMDHEGTAIVNNAHIENFPNNGLYASGPRYKCPEQDLQGDGRVVKVQGGFFKNNNIANVRVGSDNTVVQNTDIVVDQKSTSYVNAYNMRGIWVRGDGRDVSIDNVDIDYTHAGEGSTYPIIIQPQCGGDTVSSGQILDSSIQTNSDFDALRRDDGDWTCQNTEITGNGNTNSDLQC